ncbi:hypothetical protein [Actinomadura terrae]|uniref:hypothetical protein n=1 Tax=Actinomadura terrae TaxID=604353 RepID=UPI001FA7E9C5|nr:hypothetical protein [Actinomadura terrae]
MDEYGIWTESDGGFVERGLYSPEKAAARLAEIIRDSDYPDDDRADLRVREMCPKHADEEQPRNGCEGCNQDEPVS